MPASKPLAGLFALACALAGCTVSMNVSDGGDTGVPSDRTMRPGSLLTDYPVGCNFDARYVIVCRTSQSYTRDDIQVDAIEASCTCP
jgi:hypothetical protein